MMLENIRNILVIKWGAVGDIVAATPAIKALRQGFPEAHICVLGNELVRQIIPPGSLIDSLILFDDKEAASKSALAHARLVHQLRERKFDLAVNLRWNSERSGILGLLSGARYRVSCARGVSSNLYNIRVPHPGKDYHEIDRNLDIARALGIVAKNRTPYVHRTPEEQWSAEEFFQQHRLQKEGTIGIHPGASGPNKAWLPERYLEVAGRLIKRFDVKILLTWGEGERVLVDKISGKLGVNVIVSPETKSIGALAALIERCGLYLSNCTGPMNVAVAVETPTVAILGSTHPEEWAPLGSLHRTIASPMRLDVYTREQQLEALEVISVDTVWTIVERRWCEIRSEYSEQADTDQPG
jgi:ADP-heptose:LPS heptosyltransferase